MSKKLEILQKYWQYQQFRPSQEAIIDAVLEGKDTFVLLPTGGGKSLCYQLPSMLTNGICLVISPLIALMRDQVANLEKRNIKAIALTGGIPTDEIIHQLDNCEFGNYKFLYVSPERLQSDWILDRLKNLPINLIAVDEAHCISQWGHDFRPSYLKINTLKKYLPKTPIIALTATATKQVQDEIISNLGLQSAKIFKESFVRENIAYMVFATQDKLFRVSQILKKNPQPAIIYVRNRKLCVQIAQQLIGLGFTATFYHGGLTTKEKSTNMQNWISEKSQVIVATNAFGMGIDKANVKTVIHMQLPDTLENYYQETGRAGRNGNKAFAILLIHTNDIEKAKTQCNLQLIDKSFLTTLYIKLCNYFQIAYGEGIDEKFSFNLHKFCTKYTFNSQKTYAALQFLDRQGVLSLSTEFSEKIKVQFLISSKEVIRYLSLHPKDSEIISVILRSYPGIYEAKITVNIASVARKAKTTESQIEAVLQKLNDNQNIDYQAKSNDATIIFNEIREDERTISRLAKYLAFQNDLKKKQLESVLNFVENKSSCRTNSLLAYFGEIVTKNCGTCSFCIAQKNTKIDVDLLSKKVVALLKQENLNSREIEDRLKVSSNVLVEILQNLLQNNAIEIQNNNKYRIKK